ncbi:type II toxin-antitoxin system RatA family toxin [Actinophytocola oryzae]|uniref:Polyketide cyclase/dehydrase/lipid transport protein n=1 Tax=Actinophytocola oryzae TaxID=502181 RepID=A0A4R7VW11_9PSEU|nr:SRPBCC family protein [Actinophytocola oryzae]TDV54223.1 polyketide cyclase/dehydrase/lipid transport protein [Actinophytocola oryzae]
MSQYEIRLASSRDAARVHAALCRVEDVPAHAPDVLSVSRDGDTSSWVLSFRGHPVRWTQRDHHDGLRGEFNQVDGDFVALSGEWAVEPDGEGSTVAYRLSVRTSVPHLAGAIEPMVARALSRAALSVAGPVRVLAGAAVLADPVLSGRS